MPFYVTNATHSLDNNGAVGPKDGPALVMAEFIGTVIVLATYLGEPPVSSSCIGCSRDVKAQLNDSGEIEWACTSCDYAGTISHWQNTLWDNSIRQVENGARSSIRKRLSLPVSPAVRVRTLLAHLWRSYDAAGTSLGRSHEAVVLEAAMALLGPPDAKDLQRLDQQGGELINETRSYLSAVRANDFGFK